MEDFIKALKQVGAKNVFIETQRGLEGNDELTFEMGGKYFLISSGRGGDINKGSCLSFFSGIAKL